MIFRIGVAMMVMALVLAGVLAFVAMSTEEPAPAAAQIERSVPEAPELKRREIPRAARPDPPKRPNRAQPSEVPEESRPEESRPEESSNENLPITDTNLPEPSANEVVAAEGPRRYPPRQSAALTLSVPTIGLYDVPIADSAEEEALERGVVHLPETPMPWEEREQKNVYLAGHRLGYPGTGSRLVFYNLDELTRGDAVELRDRSGGAYEYRVTEVFEVEPEASWAMDSVRDRDIVTLQTCTPIPTYEKRLVIRADRVKSASLS